MESTGGGVGPRPSPNEEFFDEDEMKIFLKVMKTVAIKVNKSETVSDIKERFHKREGIPSKSQKIFYGGNHLKDWKTLIEYDISNASTLHLFINPEAVININVKLPPAGKTIMLEFMNWDTIRDIKAKIHALEGILVDHQQMLYKGRLLDDSQTLASCNIQQNSTLNLVLSSRAEMQIFVSTPNKETIALDVKTWYTIWDVKSIIESITQVSVYKLKHAHTGILLDDSRALSYYKLGNGSTLHAVLSRIQIFVRIDCGNTITLVMKVSDTIGEVMERIYQRTQIPTRYHRLEYGGKRLIVNRSLADNNVQDQSTLYLVLIPGSTDKSTSFSVKSPSISQWRTK